MSCVFHVTSFGTFSIDRVVGAIQSFLSAHGPTQDGRTLALWLFFGGCGVSELCLSTLICKPIEKIWPLTGWTQRNPIAADVAYAFFVRIAVFPWLHTSSSAGCGSSSTDFSSPIPFLRRP